MAPGTLPMTQVVIVGGGPTGLLTAVLLSARGVESVVLERSTALAPGSRAIGVTPPSLEILDSVGLADAMVSRGVLVRRAVVHNGRRPMGELRFDGVHPRFPGMLSCPQATSWTILNQEAESDRRIELRREVTACSAHREGNAVVVECDRGPPVPARVLVVADGAGGNTALELGFRRRAGSYRQRFFMADVKDRSGFGAAAHLWFTRDGSVESFPLPDARRRWIVQLTESHGGAPSNGRAAVDLEAMVARRTGIRLSPADRLWESSFQPSWSRLDRFAGGGVFVVGDAAHTMSPIGGQGMNTGFADAELAALLIALRLRLDAGYGMGKSAGDLEQVYHRARVRAAASATRRAWAGMSIGTMRGSAADFVRSHLITLLLSSPLQERLARHFAMLTIPCGRAHRSLRKMGLSHPDNGDEAPEQRA